MCKTAVFNVIRPYKDFYGAMDQVYSLQGQGCHLLKDFKEGHHCVDQSVVLMVSMGQL